MKNQRDDQSRNVEAKLSHLLNAPVCLVITDNTRCMVSLRKQAQTYRVRLHHMFLDAGDREIRAVAGLASGKALSCRRNLDAFIRRHAGSIRKPQQAKKPRRMRVRTAGRYFDLKELYRVLNREYFENSVDCSVTWGFRSRRPGRKSIKLGSFSSRTRTIRIHPALDRAWVPQYVVESVLYHEMLHSRWDCRAQSGRKRYHDRHFKAAERCFRDFERARRWIERHLPRLLAG